nr:glycosyltransferase [Capnocytophaga ochracea]
MNFRKISERFGRELREVLVKKGCEEGGGSL